MKIKLELSVTLKRNLCIVKLADKMSVLKKKVFGNF